MGSVLNYLKEVRIEISKVTWPKRDQVIRLTLLVLLISVGVGAYLGLLDFVFTKVLEKVLVR